MARIGSVLMKGEEEPNAPICTAFSVVTEQGISRLAVWKREIILTQHGWIGKIWRRFDADNQ